MTPNRAARLCGLALIASLLGSCSSEPVDAPGAAVLRLSASTTGPNPDPDGYTYSMDGGATAVLGPDESVLLIGLDAGLHTLVIGGVASNCTLAGGASRQVVALPRDTAEVFIDVTCHVPPGAAILRLTTMTTGGDPDVDGYTYALDGDAPIAIGSNTSITVNGLTPGTHQLVIGGIAGNCTLAGGTTRAVTLTSGATLDLQLSVTCQGSSPTIVATVPLPERPYGVAVSGAGVIYAALIDGQSLARGDLATRSFSSTYVDVGLTPPHVVFNPAGTTAYATLQSANGLAVVDVTTNALTTTVPLSSGGFNLIVAPDGQRVYVTTAGGALYVVDATTNTTITTLSVGAAANGLAFSPDGSVLYVSSRDAGTVVAIDPTTNTITRTYPVGGMPQRLAVAPDGSEFYVANETSGLNVVNVASGAVSSVSFGTAAYGLGITPDGTQLYVLLPAAGQVRVLDRATRAAVKTISVGGVPRNVAFASDGKALVANEQAIIFIQ